MNKILLHHCCAPCSINVLDELSKERDIEGFWYNPNIHPNGEHENRFKSLEQLLRSRDIILHVKDGSSYDIDAWKANAPPSPPERCSYCYYLRMNETAFTAKQAGIPEFSTTLLSSPYQKHDIIKQIGERVARAYGLKFYYKDFRPSYYEGRNKARRDGMYMQKYCGCEFSITERNK